jgi:hypothetical protein
MPQADTPPVISEPADRLQGQDEKSSLTFEAIHARRAVTRHPHNQ